jgi:hypothetical protein
MIIHSVDVSNWRVDDEHGIFPIGARDKQMLWSPNEPQEGIKPNWPYLFKLSRAVYPDQFWMETVAYMIGDAMNIEVPLALPSFKRDFEEGLVCGSLIEWFYDRNSQTFVHAADFFQRLITNFDNDKGSQHNIDDLFRICRGFRYEATIDFPLLWELWYFDLLIFDALTGNSDRHQENWGFIFGSLSSSVQDKRKVRLSPLFDNGTSLGHERFPERVKSWSDEQIKNYILKGQHHLRHSRSDPKNRVKHIESIKNVVLTKRKARKHMEQRLNFNLDVLLARINLLCDIEIQVPFSRERAYWTIQLLKCRYQMLTKIVCNDDD